MTNDIKPTQDTDDRIAKLERKLKLSNLLTGKKFADLELTIGKLDENLKEISTDFPRIKEKSEEIENLLSVINLGLSSYKERFDDLSSRLTKLGETPGMVKKTVLNYEKKLKSLEDNVKKISDSLNAVNTLKEDITKTVDDNIFSKIQTLSESSESNKSEIEHIKKNIDAFSSALRSFERTVELANLDVIIKRFDSIEDKMMNIRSQMEGFRNNLSTVSLKDKDVEILKQKIKETESVVLEKLGKLNEVETKINILQQKLNDLNYFDATKKMESGSKGRENITLQNQARIEELTKKLSIISQNFGKRLEEIRKMKAIGPTEPGKVTKLDTATKEEIYKRMEEMYNDVLKRISNLKGLGEKVGSVELPPDLQQTISKSEERLAALEKNYTDVLGRISDLKSLSEERKTIELPPSLNQTLSRLEGRLVTLEKNYKETIKVIEDLWTSVKEEASRKEKTKDVSKISKNLVQELSSLKEVITQLSGENKEFKKVLRDIRISQMASVEPEAFANFASKVGTLEKKLLEVEQLSKESPILEQKMIELEKLKKEVVDKVREIETKVNEESSVRPVILE